VSETCLLAGWLAWDACGRRVIFGDGKGCDEWDLTWTGGCARKEV